MRAFGLISLLVTLGIIGFLLAKQTGGSQGGTSPVQAKVMEDKARDAMALAGQVQIKAVIAQFYQDKQRWPNSLDELKSDGLIELVPDNLDYDPATGQVKVHSLAGQ